MLQCAKPMLGAPPAGVGRVDGDDGEAGVGRHLDQPMPKLAGGDARHLPPERPPPPAPLRPPAGPFPSLIAGVSKVEVLDHDRLAAVPSGQAEQLGDGRSQPAGPDRRRQAG
jgi:hypothetical protein